MAIDKFQYHGEKRIEKTRGKRSFRRSSFELYESVAAYKFLARGPGRIQC